MANFFVSAYDRVRSIVMAMPKPFGGVGKQPVRQPYGTYGKQDTFKNFGEQVIYFATSGSAGYMQDGKYWDISGAKIQEDEFREIVVEAGMSDALDPDRLNKIHGAS